MKAQSILAAMIFTLLFCAAEARADFVDLYTVDAPFSTTPKSVFSLEEEPYLYLKLPETSLGTLTLSSWESPSGTTIPGVTEAQDGKSKWLNLIQWDFWKEPGEWEVTAQYFDSDTFQFESRIASFTVTPEPISVLLFSIGGAPVAAHLYRKRFRPQV